MNKEDFIKVITYLGMAYNKTFTKIEVEQFYEFLKEYSYETLKEVTKKIIKNNKYMPSINEIIQECEITNQNKKYKILDLMKKDNYFKNINEYDKAILFINKNIIPEWLKNDMKKYNQKLIENSNLLLN